VGGLIAIIGGILLPITSGDTALRSLRLMMAEALHIGQEKSKNRILLALPVFIGAFLVLIWAKNDPNGFNTIWRYFGWSNQTLAVFALASILIWMMRHDKAKFLWIPLIPLVFYSFVTCSYIMNAKIGFGLPLGNSLCIGAVFAVLVTVGCILRGRSK
jgi:carbon starvation protein CstA